jgi:phosphoenolpyruvate carboxylase
VHFLASSGQLILEHYLDEIHLLGAELSLSARLVAPTPALAELAAASGVTSNELQDEPCESAMTPPPPCPPRHALGQVIFASAIQIGDH